MKNILLVMELGKTEKSYQVKIPENVVDLKVFKKSNGIFLQYVDKKIEWATNIIERYSKSLKAFHFDGILGISFVELSYRRTGFSRCSKKDRFNQVIGKAIAICRAAGEEIPDFI